MEVKEVQFTDIFSCKEISVIRAKYYEKDAFLWAFMFTKKLGLLPLENC